MSRRDQPKALAFILVFIILITLTPEISTADEGIPFSQANIAAAVNEFYSRVCDAEYSPYYVVQYDLNNDGIDEFIITVERGSGYHEVGMLIYQHNGMLHTYELYKYGFEFYILQNGYLCRGSECGGNPYEWSYHFLKFSPDTITEHTLSMYETTEYDDNGDETGYSYSYYSDRTEIAEEEYLGFWEQFGTYKDWLYLHEMENVINKFITPASAVPTTSRILVNGIEKSFEAYNIRGSNYFKLRDLAFILSGTDKQFEVSWDAAKNAIILASGEPYTVIGGEMKGAAIENKKATISTSKIYSDGSDYNIGKSLRAYTIDGNNFFKLRDVMSRFNVYVGWDSATSTITLDTSREYEWV